MRLKNKDVILKFVRHIDAENEHLCSHNGKLYSYNTVIAQWAEWNNPDFTLLLNTTKYSVTSSIHLGILKRCILQYVNVYVASNINYNETDLLTLNKQWIKMTKSLLC